MSRAGAPGQIAAATTEGLILERVPRACLMKGPSGPGLPPRMTRALPGATRCPRGPGRPRAALAQLLMEARRGSSCYSLGTMPEGAGRPPSWRCPEPPGPPRWGKALLPPVSWPRPSHQALGSALDPPLLDHRATSSFPQLQPYPRWAGQVHKDGVSIQSGFLLARWVDSLLQPQHP